VPITCNAPAQRTADGNRQDPYLWSRRNIPERNEAAALADDGGPQSMEDALMKASVGSLQFTTRLRLIWIKALS
jgi:hypothetical protein